MSVTRVAKNYLQGKPLTVHYYQQGEGSSNLKKLYSEEYPEHIPRKDDLIKLKSPETFIVIQTLFIQEDNVIEILLEDYKEYMEVRYKTSRHNK